MVTKNMFSQIYQPILIRRFSFYKLLINKFCPKFCSSNLEQKRKKTEKEKKRFDERESMIFGGWGGFIYKQGIKDK